MTTYIIKVILCSGVFLIAYKLLLEKERMHAFKRFYLLSVLLLSFAIPLIRFNSASPIPLISDNEIFNTSILQFRGITQTLSSAQSTNYIFPIFLSIYATIAILLLLRFAINLRKIVSKVWTQQTLAYKKSKIILIEDDASPHSFLKYIFINKEEFNAGKISPEILIHEYSHIEQKHSYDILFTEILQIVTWFNPFLIFYKKAIQLNHEFLADESVINSSQNISGYQYLLIDRANKVPDNLTSRLNYSITKKRLVMMTRTKSLRTNLCRQMALIPVFALAVFVFSNKIIAQTPTVIPKSKQMSTPSTQEGVSQELLNEYEQIVNKNKNAAGNPDYRKFTEGDKNRLETIYLAMSKEQQAKQLVIFLPAPSPSPKVVPTKAQIESWKNAKVYGLWINNKRVSNSELDKYENTDFAHAFVSYLHKNARKPGGHTYQVDLMTIKAYETYYKKAIESKDKYHMAFTWSKASR